MRRSVGSRAPVLKGSKHPGKRSARSKSPKPQQGVCSGVFQSLCWKQIFIFQEFVSRVFHCKLNCRCFSRLFDTVVWVKILVWEPQNGLDRGAHVQKLITACSTAWQTGDHHSKPFLSSRVPENGLIDWFVFVHMAVCLTRSCTHTHTYTNTRTNTHTHTHTIL